MKPEPIWVKLNIDGSVNGTPHRVAYGGVLRDNAGEWICGYYGFLGNEDILFMELTSIRVELSTNWNLGFNKIWCETDSMEAW